MIKIKIPLPTFDVYCDNTTGHNALVFDLGNGLRVWFSYQTPVAFKDGPFPLVVRENDWGPTTGKHLNAIDQDKKSRVSGEVFEELLSYAQADRSAKLHQRLVELGKIEATE